MKILVLTESKEFSIVKFIADHNQSTDFVIAEFRDNMKLDPDSNSIKFKHGDTEITLGHDTYRNAGDGQKLEGKASKALQDCLEGKRKAEQKGK